MTENSIFKQTTTSRFLASLRHHSPGMKAIISENSRADIALQTASNSEDNLRWTQMGLTRRCLLWESVRTVFQVVTLTTSMKTLICTEGCKVNETNVHNQQPTQATTRFGMQLTSSTRTSGNCTSVFWSRAFSMREFPALLELLPPEGPALRSAPRDKLPSNSSMSDSAAII